MPSPITVAAFKTRTIMPGADVDQLELVEPGYLLQTLGDRWDWILARLRKRYDVAAMQADPPATAIRWLADMATFFAYSKRGWNPGSEQDKESISAAKTSAEAEVKEAADSKDGLFELPLLAGSAPTTGSGVSRGGPLGYTETSPYVWSDQQACTGRSEDMNGRGSG